MVCLNIQKELFPHLKGIFYHIHFPHKLLKIASEMLFSLSALPDCSLLEPDKVISQDF